MESIKKMKRMHYLIIVISVFFLLASSQCSKRIELPLIKGNYVYLNSTSKEIVMSLFDSRISKISPVDVFYIAVNDSVKFQWQSEMAFPFYSEAKKSVTGDSVSIKRDVKCITNDRKEAGGFDGNGVFNFRNYDNYTSELISQDNFTLYYTFNDEDFENAQECD